MSKQLNRLGTKHFETFEGNTLSIVQFDGISSQALAGDIQSIEELSLWFAPTGILQKVAMGHDWHDYYMTLASEFDQAVIDIK